MRNGGDCTKTGKRLTALILSVMLLASCGGNTAETTAAETTRTITETSPPASSETAADTTTAKSTAETASSLSETTATSALSETEATSETTVTTVVTTTETTVTTTLSTTAATSEATTAPPPETTVATTEKPPAQPSEPYIITPVASGKKTEETDLGVIDFSNCADGYVMCSYKGKKKKVKVQITAPSGVTYSYNLDSGGKYEVFPLSEGSGKYRIGIYENVSDNSYAKAADTEIDYEPENSLLPFLTPNQYVNYNKDSKAVELGSKLCAGAETDTEKIDAVYSWIVDNVTYDKALAKDAQSGYLPNIDGTVTKKTGICLDYAGTACAMLRSQKIPTKLVVGYAGTIYHAWLSVYTKEQGWIYGIIYFDGTSWHRMDPTFAAGNKSSKKIMSFIGDDENYTAKFIY